MESKAMANKRTELEVRLLEEHGEVIGVVERWQSEQRAVDEVRVALAAAEARLDDAVLEAAELGDRAMVSRLLDLPEAQVRKMIAASRRAAKRREAEAQPDAGTTDDAAQVQSDPK
jgi:hypothetical protein